MGNGAASPAAAIFSGFSFATVTRIRILFHLRIFILYGSDEYRILDTVVMYVGILMGLVWPSIF